MGTTVTLLFCVLVLCSYQVTQGQILADCCLSVSDKVIPKSIIVGYESQVKNQGCNMDATIFITRKKMRLCAPKDAKWVTDREKYIDDNTKWCKDIKYKDNRCKKFKF